MAHNNDPQRAIMEEARDALDKGELPPKVGFNMLWGALIAIHDQTKKTNGQVAKNTNKIRWITGVLATAGTILAIFGREVVSFMLSR